MSDPLRRTTPQKSGSRERERERGLCATSSRVPLFVLRDIERESSFSSRDITREIQKEGAFCAFSASSDDEQKKLQGSFKF